MSIVTGRSDNWILSRVGVLVYGVGGLIGSIVFWSRLRHRHWSILDGQNIEFGFLGGRYVGDIFPLEAVWYTAMPCRKLGILLLVLPSKGFH